MPVRTRTYEDRDRESQTNTNTNTNTNKHSWRSVCAHKVSVCIFFNALTQRLPDCQIQRSFHGASSSIAKRTEDVRRTSILVYLLASVSQYWSVPYGTTEKTVKLSPEGSCGHSHGLASKTSTVELLGMKSYFLFSVIALITA